MISSRNWPSARAAWVWFRPCRSSSSWTRQWPRRSLRRMSGECPGRRNFRDSPLSGRDQAIQVLLGVERGHAAAAGAGDGLAVHMVLDVAGGEHARHAGGRGEALAAAAGDDIAVFHLELAGE